MDKETFDIRVEVGVSVEAETQEEAEQIARDWVGVTANAPDSIGFSYADLM